MKRNHPMVPSGKINGVSSEVCVSALSRWDASVRAQASGDIDIFGIIGSDWDGTGTTVTSVTERLRAVGADSAITVNINSPGGDMFEGLAIYNVLRMHRGEVTVNILGIAASAASIVAMAGDSVNIAPSAFLMIHNAWVISAGNRHDFRQVADTLEPFDVAMADIYAARSGDTRAAMSALMDAETWINAESALSMGFGDKLLDVDKVSRDANAQADVLAAKRLDVILARAGIPRTERRKLMQEYKSAATKTSGTGTRNAADDDTPRAVISDGKALSLSLELKGILP